MEESTKSSEENKMVEAERLESEEQIQNGVIKSEILGGQKDRQRVAEVIRSIARMELGEI